MINRFVFVLLFLIIIGGAVLGSESKIGNSNKKSGFDTVGLYIWTDTPDQHAFWKSCGINTLQFCDLGWCRNLNLHDSYYKGMAAGIDKAKKDGFKTNVLLFANIRQWKGPQDLEPSGIGTKFHPSDEAAMQERLMFLAKTVKALHNADSFSFLGGDPGGVPSDLGPATVQDWITMAKRVHEVVKREAPHAVFNVNPWAITMWQYPDLGCGSSEWWLKETELTKIIINEKDFIGSKIGVELAGHNYYRAMALRNYSRDGINPEPFPTADDVKMLKNKGTTRIWAWPYFLLDEADDGDVGPDGSILPLPQSETRYIYKLVSEMRAIGMTGIMGSWSYAGYLAKAPNTYAFGRFCNDPDATPAMVIDEYAKCVADDSTWASLAQILRFIENNSNWQRKLPKERQLPNYECNIQSADMALAKLARIVPRDKPLFALPEPAPKYLSRLKERLELIKNKSL